MKLLSWLLLVHILLASPSSSQAFFFDNIFCFLQGQPCIFGIFGSFMHQMDGTECTETCAFLPFFMFGWTCGACEGADSGNPDDNSMDTDPYEPPPEVEVPDIALPPRPYIEADYSELIVMPKLKEASDLIDPRQDCPHEQSGLSDWHLPTTWPGGALPTAGSDVMLPPNTQVVLRKSATEEFGVITIPLGSSLIIGEANEGITLGAKGINVQGKLIAGSETCKIRTDIVITLHGARPPDPVASQPDPTYKGIAVDGVVSLHGKRYFRTWTRLAATVEAGEKVLVTQHMVNWEPGQKIVLTTTALKDSREWHQNEEHTVLVTDSISGGGSAVYLKDAVKYKHIASKGYQAEVGLLSRTIRIQGAADDSEPTDSDPLDCTVARKRNGDDKGPCPGTELTGFGAHMIVHGNGKGYVEGVEFYRMGQTNTIGRYPMHFHLLGTCADCYIRACSVHRSYYRCITIHGTNNATVTENVCYDVIGMGYYMEDGVEENNMISFNLAAFIHMINPSSDPPGGTGGQGTEIFQSNSELLLPADVSASGFYITNAHNYIIGNAASGGWAGFNFPNLQEPRQFFRGTEFRPSSATGLSVDGNTAHSSGWWWGHAGAFYFGGVLYLNGNGVEEYNPGRNHQNFQRCDINACEQSSSCGCPKEHQQFLNFTNNKAFLSASVGFNSWSGTMNVMGWETHDVSLSLESLSGGGFWITDMLSVCRTGEDMVTPEGARHDTIRADGFGWYDTGQEHIITEAVFRHCGYRSDQFNQYDDSPDRGCGDETANGCHPESAVFRFTTHSDQFTPEIMQGTRAISFESCGRRYSLKNWQDLDSVSIRQQNWIDADGTASGLGESVMMVSGVEQAASWWQVDDDVVYDPQGPMRFIKTKPFPDAPERALGHLTFYWDDSLHNQVGESICGNGNADLKCVAHGYFRHAGKKFAGTQGIALTARGDIVGPVGGFGWILNTNTGEAPRKIHIEAVEVLKETPLLISIAYPVGTTFTITAGLPDWCWNGNPAFPCSQTFSAAARLEEVRKGAGNQYFVDSEGVLTFRVAQPPSNFLANPWFIPGKDDPGKNGEGFAVPRFERDGVYLPSRSWGPYLSIEANCGGSGVYCTGSTVEYDPDVCPPGYEQVSYDYCCSGSDCVFADEI